MIPRQTTEDKRVSWGAKESWRGSRPFTYYFYLVLAANYSQFCFEHVHCGQCSTSALVQCSSLLGIRQHCTKTVRHNAVGSKIGNIYIKPMLRFTMVDWFILNSGCTLRVTVTTLGTQKAKPIKHPHSDLSTPKGM